MDVNGFLDARGFESQAEGALERGAGHRFGGGGSALAVVAFGREEQCGMFMGSPLLAQELERALGQGNVTITIAFARADVQEHAPGIDIGNGQAQAFAQAQAAGIDGGQSDAMIQGGNGRENFAHFAGREDDREFELGIGAGQFQFVRPHPFESFLPEELDGAESLGAGLAGGLLDGFEMNEVLAELFRSEQVGRAIVELAELAQAGEVGLFGARADGQEREIIGEGF